MAENGVPQRQRAAVTAREGRGHYDTQNAGYGHHDLRHAQALPVRGRRLKRTVIIFDKNSSQAIEVGR